MISVLKKNDFKGNKKYEKDISYGDECCINCKMPLCENHQYGNVKESPYSVDCTVILLFTLKICL